FAPLSFIVRELNAQAALTVPPGLPDWAFNVPDKIQPTAVVAGSAPAQSPSMDGVWRSQGYGNVFEIHGPTLNEFEVTNTTCVAGGTAAVDTTPVPGRTATFRTPGGSEMFGHVSFVSQREDRIHAAGTMRRDQSGQHRNDCQQQQCPDRDGRVVALDPVQLGGDKPSESQSGRDSDHQPNRQQDQHFPHDGPQNRRALRAEREADPELLSP